MLGQGLTQAPNWPNTSSRSALTRLLVGYKEKRLDSGRLSMDKRPQPLHPSFSMHLDLSVPTKRAETLDQWLVIILSVEHRFPPNAASAYFVG